MNRRTFLSASAHLGGWMLLQMTVAGCGREAAGPQLTLAPLPYPQDALAPHLSEATLATHHGKHHAGYVERTRRLAARSRSGPRTLDEVIAAARKAGDTVLFNNAAQVLNHDLYWQSMTPGGGGEPEGSVQEALKRDFGGYPAFRDAVAEAAADRFGSGWVWLVHTDKGLKVAHTADAQTPAADGAVVLMALDVWEHAYYLDYRNRRMDYVAAFLDHLVNWDFAERQLRAASGGDG